MSMLIPHDCPQPPDTDQQAEADERLWQHYCAVAQRLDVGALLSAVCDQLRGETADTPLSALLEDWQALPQWDWQHPTLSPWQAEAVGRYVAGVVAEVLAQAIAVALAREEGPGPRADRFGWADGDLTLTPAEED